MTKSRAQCDIVIPVYGGVHFVQDLIRSIERSTKIPYRILIIDDSDDAPTHAQLQSLANLHATTAQHGQIEIHRNPRNLGFVGTSNRGFELCETEFVCLLNSDTLVSDGWLERMIACARRDPAIAIVNPVCNRAANLSVAIPPGYSLNTLPSRLRSLSRNRAPDITTAVGFCMLIRSTHLEIHGGFDPAYGMGYCEESDLCMRFTEAGLRVVLAEDAFVYHKGEGSFVARDARYKKNRIIFDQRWSESYTRDYKAFMARDPIQDIRDDLLLDTIDTTEWTPRLARLRERRPGDESIDPRPRTASDPEQRNIRYPTPAYLDALGEVELPTATDGEPALRITFIVAEMPISGGVIAIAQLAREMLLAGHDVRVVTAQAREVDPERFNLPVQPIVYPNREELIRLFPESDIVVSTYWTTVSDYVVALRKTRKFVSVYYVQDYEVEFFDPSDKSQRQAAGATYGMTDHILAESAWVEEQIRENHDVDCDRVSLGMDRGIFWDRSEATLGTPVSTEDAAERPRVLSVARPADRRRGFLEAVHIFERIHRVRPEVELVFFGTPEEEMPAFLPFPSRNEGRIQNHDQVAQLISSCDVLLDSSLFQGFGRPGLEAMACGTPSVLTMYGGIHEYARHDENCLMGDPRLTRVMSDMVLRLLDDAALCDRFRASGFETAARFDLRNTAAEHLHFYRKWTNKSLVNARSKSRESTQHFLR